MRENNKKTITMLKDKNEMHARLEVIK